MSFTTLPNDFLADYLARQRWFAGDRPLQVTVTTDESLVDGPAPMNRIVVDVDGVLYQLLAGRRPADALPDFVTDEAVIGDIEGEVFYDALVDPELALALLEIVSGEPAERVRPVGADQSNTSLVYDDRVILKVFRRLAPGPNPDVEVTTALDAVGFNHVPEPLAVWRQDGVDLAIAHEYLAGGSEGWALALTSLRDLYAARADPALSGGDFAGDAERLGTTTARLHLALAEAFGVQPDGADPYVIRVHGDYHLGQVMRTDLGWYILDFEGEPARPLEERRRPSSPYKDVAGMLRSFDYAAQVALRERGEDERDGLREAGEAWEERNRNAFLAGYEATKGIDELLPADPDQRERRLRFYELEKARYEQAYERAHRPDWEDIPRAAIARLEAEESA
jgi:maltokinase